MASSDGGRRYLGDGGLRDRHALSDINIANIPRVAMAMQMRNTSSDSQVTVCTRGPLLGEVSADAQITRLVLVTLGILDRIFCYF